MNMKQQIKVRMFRKIVDNVVCHEKDDIEDGIRFEDVPNDWVIEFGDGEKGIKTGPRHFYSYRRQGYALVDDLTLKVKKIKRVCSPGKMQGNR